MHLVQADKKKHDPSAQAASSEPLAHGPSHEQLKGASFAEGSALLAPVQAKGGITIGAHKTQAPQPAPPPSAAAKPGGIVIGAHKGAPPQPAAPPSAAAKPGGIVIGAHKAPPVAPPGGSNAPPSPVGMPQSGGASGIVIGAHKTPLPPGQQGPAQAGAGPTAAVPSGAGVVVAGPPQKPLPPIPKKPGGPPQKPPPPIPHKPGAPPQKPLPATPVAAGPAAAVVSGGVPQAPMVVGPPQVVGTAGSQQAVAGPAMGAQAAPQQVVVAPPPDPVQVEQQAEAEDKAKLSDIDGEIDVFSDEGKTAAYFSSRVPATWHSLQPANYPRIEQECTLKGVSRHELYALIGYSGPGYAPMNRLTRGEMKSKRFTNMFKPYTQAASAAIGKLGTPTVKHTQRGWREIRGGDDTVVESLYHREFVEEKGFMSTTLNSDQSYFAGPVSIQIAGKSGVDIQLLSMVPSEGEVLYAPKTHFKVARFQRNADVEPGWRAWHQDKNNLKPTKPWFEVDLEEK